MNLICGKVNAEKVVKDMLGSNLIVFDCAGVSVSKRPIRF